MTSFVISAIALFVISITMLARANDLRWRPGIKWQVRLVGFILSGCTPIGIIGMEWLTQEWPTPYEAIFRVGLMCVFMTTPYLPPWWRWISGKDEADETN
jgi:hypothetical protein